MIGNQNQWITIQAEEGIKVIIDGAGANIPSGGKYPYNTGLIQIENAAFIRLLNINVQNSHRSGINIQDSHHIDVINCTAENSLSPGIAAWQQCEYMSCAGKYGY